MITVTDNADIRAYTTFNLPARCKRFVEYSTSDDLQQLFAQGMLHDAIHIGGGSNLLFVDGVYNGTVVHCTNTAITIAESGANNHSDNNSESNEVIVDVAAGCKLDDLCQLTAEQGLWGMENLSGIPGEIGGAAVQNVGAYGTEFKDIAVEVCCFDTVLGQHRTIPVAKCNYGYRTSHFKSQSNLIVTGAKVKLTRLHSPNLQYAALEHALHNVDSTNLTPMQVRNAVIELRNSKLPNPASVGSAGSFFKNPVVNSAIYHAIEQATASQVPGHLLPSGEYKLSAAWLIDNANCKSMTSGDASLWQLQPLVLVNATGNATGADVLSLENKIKSAVATKFGIKLTAEVVHIHADKQADKQSGNIYPSI